MMKEIVAVLGPDSDWLTIADIAAKVYDTEEPSHIQRSAVARSARMLADQGSDAEGRQPRRVSARGPETATWWRSDYGP